MANGIELAKAYVQIIPTTESIGSTLQSALSGSGITNSFDNEGQKSGTAFAGGIAKAIGIGTAAIATATVAAVGAVASQTSAVAELGDTIDKQSQKLGISATAYQEWEAVLQHSGTSMSIMGASFKKLANAAQDASSDQVAAFERIGLSMEEVASMSTEELWAATINGLQGMEEGTERTAIATDLLGRGATELGALLNTSAEDTQAMIDAVNELGGVMSEDAVKAAATYEDTLQDLKTSFSGLRNSMIGDFMPAVTEVMQGLTGIVGGDSEGGLAILNQGITDFVNNLVGLIPQFAPVAVEIVGTLANAIIENLPTLMNTGMQLIEQLLNAIMGMLPELILTGAELIVTLVQGFADMAPSLMPQIIDCVLLIITTLTQPDMLNQLLNAGVQLLEAIFNGITQAFPQIISYLPTMIANIATTFVSNLPKILNVGVSLIKSLLSGIVQAVPNLLAQIPAIGSQILNAIKNALLGITNIGQNIVEGLWNGIKSGWSWLTDSVSNLAGGLLGGVKSILGIASPSKEFAKIGKFIDEGMVVGIKSGMDDVENAMDDVVSATTGGFNLDAGITSSNVVTHDYSTSEASGILDLLRKYLPSLENPAPVVLDTGVMISELAPGMSDRLELLSYREARR